MKNIAHYLDYANHHQNATHADVQLLCEAVMQYHLNAVFVNPVYIAYAKEQLNGKKKVGTVVSFPLGQELHAVNLASIKQAVHAGADELDIALNTGAIKEGRWDELLQTMRDYVACARDASSHVIVKCIPETGYLEAFEIQKMAELMVQAGVDFFKTCSGMGPRGATIEDVKLVRQAVGSAIKVKVAGGITTYAQACDFIAAGVDRIGTSHAVEIVKAAV